MHGACALHTYYVRIFIHKHSHTMRTEKSDPVSAWLECVGLESVGTECVCAQHCSIVQRTVIIGGSCEESNSTERIHAATYSELILEATAPTYLYSYNVDRALAGSESITTPYTREFGSIYLLRNSFPTIPQSHTISSSIWFLSDFSVCRVYLLNSNEADHILLFELIYFSFV